MVKKLIFIMPSLTSGGGEKSLVTLLNKLDFNKYSVDLFLLSHEGLFMEFVPKEVRILPLPKNFTIFSLPLLKSICKFLLKGSVILAYNRAMFTFRNRNLKNVALREQYNWKYISKSLGLIEGPYDAAIGFLEKTSTYICIDKVDSATRKIGWVHIDYDQLGMDPSFDQSYFSKLDQIVTVSEECANILESRFPEQRDKVKVIYNIVSPSIINKMAEQGQEELFGKKENQIVIVSIGRLHYQKNFVMAIESCRILIDRGYNILWNIIGDGEEKQKLMELIKEYGLEENFKLLGLKSNPYPYVKQADIYSQTSRFEGKSIAIDEAKILNKPIIVTNFTTAKDQINQGVDGIISEMNADDLANEIEILINDVDLRKRLSDTLAKQKLGTEDEIEKFYELIG
ncbi:glycosyltransferase [Paenibacillus sp. LMG 31461]|uniref:Glycosyltransferase n=1 Tax=Paenibacillus plantarum TaxID=2654975 RepID=A0ABX1XB62_9BACL|nr:glycosyltransferase [Paenibacillus plantarum]NOU65180.1 glycosyltransferase [Paenibacillus plantarum]